MDTPGNAAAAAAATLYRVILMIVHERHGRRHRHRTHTRYVGTLLLHVRDAYTVAELIIALATTDVSSRGGGSDSSGGATVVAALRGLPVSITLATPYDSPEALDPRMRLVAAPGGPHEVTLVAHYRDTSMRELPRESLVLYWDERYTAAAATACGGATHAAAAAGAELGEDTDSAALHEFVASLPSYAQMSARGGARTTRLGMFYPRAISGAALASAAAASLGLDPAGKYTLATDRQMVAARARGRVGMWNATLVACDAPHERPFGRRYRGTTLHLVRARVDPARVPLSAVYQRAPPLGALEVAPWLADAGVGTDAAAAFDPRELVQVRANDMVPPNCDSESSEGRRRAAFAGVSSACVASKRAASLFAAEKDAAAAAAADAAQDPFGVYPSSDGDEAAASAAAAMEPAVVTVDTLQEASSERPRKRARTHAENEEAMRALLECPVCNEVPERPCVPACGHLVCQRCHVLIRAEAPDHVYMCPLCRRRAPAHADGASASSASGADERLRVFYELAALVAHA